VGGLSVRAGHCGRIPNRRRTRHRSFRGGRDWRGRKGIEPLAELLIDAEEDRMVCALLVGMLRERAHGERRT
jgi:hypothetical protein